jgi:ribosomal protein S18 acetylase RimI-like enzyme
VRRIYAWEKERDHQEKRSTKLFGAAAMLVRPAVPSDDEAIRWIITPIIRAGETYALPSGWTEAEALAYWRSPGHTVFVADDDAVVGTYYIRPNQRGGGSHVANCAFMTAAATAGRGVASAMCAHSLRYAAAAGYLAMQFNFVVSTNSRAIELWRRFGFEIVGRLPEGFRHPTLGLVDALVMYRKL